MKVISIASSKGGVGKSTVCANLCVALRQAGHAVLALDLDPQNALRFHLGEDPNASEGVSGASLAGLDWRGMWRPGPSGVYLLGYGATDEAEREDFEQLLRNDPDWLRSSLEALQFPAETIIVIDTPPGPSVYMRQALRAADLPLVVMLADAASYATLTQMQELLSVHGENRPGSISPKYIVNQVDQSRQLSRDVLQVLRAGLGEDLIACVHLDQGVAEALASATTVLDYDGASQSARDFQGCALAIDELLGRQTELIHDAA